MQSIELKQHVPCHDEFRVAITPRRIGGERIIARHVRVNDFDPMLRRKPGHLVRARHV